MFDIFNSGYAPFQTINIAVHVGFGSIAILLGAAQLFTRKGGRVHAWTGRAYLALFCVVLFTALIGTFSFGFRSFLAALTLSSGYWLISGLRVLHLQEGGPRLLDNVAAMTAIVLAVAIAIVMRSQPGQLTVPAYIALGNVASICVYDLARNLNGEAWLRRSWLNEHIYKMIGSHGALISAAGGNLFVELQPWSIFLPPMVSLGLVFVFVLRHPLKSTSNLPT